MSKTQFWILNVIGGVCALLIPLNLLLTDQNERSGQVVMTTQQATQNEVGRAQQIQNTMQNLVMRIYQAGQSDMSLSNLLVRHDFKVNLPPEAASDSPKTAP